MKPLLSLDKREARQRVLGLYRAWWRQIPFMHREYMLPFTEDHSKKTLKAKFMENAHVKDIRVIDMLVIKVRVIITKEANALLNACVHWCVG